MTAEAVAQALGGKKVLKKDVHSEFDLAAAAMEGISASAAAEILDRGFLKPDEFYELVIPRRTFERRREENEPLTVTESDRLLRVVRVIIRAIQALGDGEKAATWLRTTNRSLRGLAPLAMLETDIGARMVEQILGRIEHGVYS